MAELTFAEDFTTSNVSLDSELKGIPDSGLFWNRGVHPLLTIDNILEIAPLLEITPDAWESGTTYGKYTDSFELGNIVLFSGVIYQSLTTTNLNNQPDTNPTNWLETSLDSLRIKALIHSSKQNMVASTKLTRKLIENQFIYHVAENDINLPNDFAGWAFEPKGSDYVKIRINEIAFQANTATPQNLYVVNQGQLIATLILNPNNGILSFEQLGYTISGKGAFYFLVDAQSVKSDGSYNDALKYDGFVCYPVTATGLAPESAEITETFSGNGLNFNVSSYLDSTNYIENNIVDFARMWQLQFAYDITRMFLYNPNTRSNRNERIISGNLVEVEAIDTNLETVAKKYMNELNSVKQSINRTFDRFLKAKPSFKMKRTTF
jgi:hypothetical protein